MKILVAINSFKGTISSQQASQLVADEICKTEPAETIVCPVSDGGDGFLQVMQSTCPGTSLEVVIPAPWIGGTLSTEIIYCSENASFVIESARVFGLTRIPHEERRPLMLSSSGLGYVFPDLEKEFASQFSTARKILIGLGGSGINDFGIGAASVFGLSLIDDQDNVLEPIPFNFPAVKKIILPTKKLKLPLHLVLDVESDLFGEKGTSRVFGPQKGATPVTCSILEDGIKNLLTILKRDHGLDYSDQRIGASGGVALGLSLFADITYIPAKNFILDTLCLRKLIEECDVVITGEGRVDMQTLMNKAPGVIIAEAARQRKKVFVVCGEFDGTIKPEFGETAVFELKKHFSSLEESIQNTEQGLLHASKELAAFLF